MKNIIPDLVALADQLDRLNLTKEANLIDNLMAVTVPGKIHPMEFIRKPVDTTQQLLFAKFKEFTVAVNKLNEMVEELLKQNPKIKIGPMNLQLTESKFRGTKGIYGLSQDIEKLMTTLPEPEVSEQFKKSYKNLKAQALEAIWQKWQLSQRQMEAKQRRIARRQLIDKLICR